MRRTLAVVASLALVAGVATGSMVDLAAAPAAPAAVRVAVDGEAIYIPEGVTVTIVGGNAPEVSPSPSLSATASPAPSSAPSPTPAPSASVATVAPATSSPTPAPTALPSVAPTPAATSLPTASPPTGTFIGPELAHLATSGPAWTRLLAEAGKAPDINLADLNSNGDVVTLAKAMVAARTGDATKRQQVVDALVKVQSSGVDRALELARGLGAYVLAADYIGYRDPAFVSWVRAQLTRPVAGGPANLIACHEQRPNNWGTWCGSSRIVADLYLGDQVDLAKAVAIFRGWLGDRAQYAGFAYGELSWQSDPTKPVGINPIGAVKSGRNIDGVLPDDQRRGGSFTWPPPCENYVHEALQGVTLTAAVLAEAGYPAWTWSNGAIARAFAWSYANGCPATGDDTGNPWVVNHYAGTDIPTAAAAPGKGFVGHDWLWP